MSASEPTPPKLSRDDARAVDLLAAAGFDRNKVDSDDALTDHLDAADALLQQLNAYPTSELSDDDCRTLVDATMARINRAEADRQAAVIVAEAQRDAELARGEGDAKAALIFAAAYGKAPRFYAFWRSLEAYRVSLAEGTTLVLSPGHGFFEFFGPGPVEAGMAGERETSSPGR